MKNHSNNEEEKLKAALKGNNSPFNVPSGYFEELPGKIADQVSKLPDFEKTAVLNPFEVPADYFENLPEAIAQKLQARSPKPFSWLKNLQRPKIAIPIAFATIVILAGLFFYKQRVSNYQQQEEITADDLHNSYFLETIDEELIVEVLDKQKADTTYDSYEQYLIENNIDLSQIENAL